MFQLKKAHADWYPDGVDGDTMLWRLDWPIVQVQLFATVVDWDEDAEKPPTNFCFDRLFIERDIRDHTGENRVDYACLTDKQFTDADAVFLLTGGLERAARHLQPQLAKLIRLPGDPEMLGPASGLHWRKPTKMAAVDAATAASELLAHSGTHVTLNGGKNWPGELFSTGQGYESTVLCRAAELLIRDRYETIPSRMDEVITFLTAQLRREK